MFGQKPYWVAEPENWEELRQAIAEDVFLSYDPNAPVDHSDILSKF